MDYIIATITLLFLDAIYFSITGSFFSSMIKSIQKEPLQIKDISVVITYIIMMIGLYVLILSKKREPYEAFVSALTQVSEYTLPTALEELVTHAEYYAKKITNKESHVTRQRFTKWLGQALLRGAGPAHRATKQET